MSSISCLMTSPTHGRLIKSGIKSAGAAALLISWLKENTQVMFKGIGEPICSLLGNMYENSRREEQ